MYPQWQPMQIRNATATDFPRILALNQESVQFLSPLTPARLAHLDAQAAYHRVILDEAGNVVAFLLALREGGDYDSVNYQWFKRTYARFLYIDRVVVALSHQGQNIGSLLYDDLFAFATQSNALRVTAEFDTDPPNEASRRFHARYGFEEVGAQAVAGGKKSVSLQSVLIS
jgi:uncharacterized protein